MRRGSAGEIDHFFSTIASLEGSGGYSPGPASADPAPPDRERLGREFTQLLAPLIGPSAAGDLFRRTMERIRGQKPESLRILGALAAFFLGEEDGDALGEADYREIQHTLEDVSGEMDLDTLTVLMGKLLSRGFFTGKQQ